MLKLIACSRKPRSQTKLTISPGQSGRQGLPIGALRDPVGTGEGRQDPQLAPSPGVPLAWGGTSGETMVIEGGQNTERRGESGGKGLMWRVSGNHICAARYTSDTVVLKKRRYDIERDILIFQSRQHL